MQDLLAMLFSDPSLEARCCAIDASSGNRLTFGELKWKSLRIAQNLGRNRRVGICMSPSLECIVTLVGVARLGIPYVALDPNLPPERLASFIRDSGVDIVIGSAGDASRGEIGRSFDDMLAAPDSEAVIPETDMSEIERRTTSHEDIFCILYTSGSSGTPKGVQIPHRAVLNRLHWQWAAFPFQADDVCSVKTAIGFVDSIAELWAPLLKAIPVVTLAKPILMAPHLLLETLNRFQITHLLLVPSLLRMLAELVERGGPPAEMRLRHVVASGEVLPPALARDFFRVFGNCTLSNYYGTTEVMGDVMVQTFHGIEDVDRLAHEGRLSIGRPIDNTALMLDDLDDDGVGEMVFTGAGIGSGYLHTVAERGPHARFARTEDGRPCFRTGDRGKLVRGEFAIHVGRHDSQVKIAGNRLDLSEVEIVLRDHCACNNPIVLFDGADIVVFLSEDERPVNLERPTLQRWLPDYAIPHVVRVARIPHLPVSGKVDRQSLLETFRERRALLEVLASVGVSPAALEGAMDRNFFALGGTSLNAMAAVSQLQKRGFDVSIESFLHAETVAGILRGAALRHPHSAYAAVSANDVGMASAVGLLSSSFLESETLLTWLHGSNPLKKAACAAEIATLFEHTWPYGTHDGLSYGATRGGRCIGFALNLSEEHAPSILPELPLVGTIVRFLTEIEAPLMAQLKSEGIRRIVHGFALGIDRNEVVTAPDRIRVTLFLEKELLRIAKEKGYEAVVTTNTHPLTEDIAVHALGYEPYAVVRHLADWVDATNGRRPFRSADPARSVTVCLKRL